MLIFFQNIKIETSPNLRKLPTKICKQENFINLIEAIYYKYATSIILNATTLETLLLKLETRYSSSFFKPVNILQRP